MLETVARHEQCCEKCQFWIKASEYRPGLYPLDGENGYCRRNAPHVPVVPHDSIVKVVEDHNAPDGYREVPDEHDLTMTTLWPMTMRDDWCGEWSLQGDRT